MEEKSENPVKEIIEWVVCIVIALVLAILVRHFIFTPTVVEMTSMKPTFEQGDRLILNKWFVTTKKELQRGDIITFEAPSVKQLTTDQYDPNNPVAIYDEEPDNFFYKFIHDILEINVESYIKRVIGLPGDHILIDNGNVYLNGQIYKESYLKEDVKTERTGLVYDITVPEGYIFAIGDNRPGSQDSRMFGCVPIDKIQSKVWVRFWPFDKMGKVS